MKNCFVLHLEDAVQNIPQIGIADLTNVDEMVPTTMTVTRINIPAAHRGQGHGSTLLKMILAEADAEGVSLSLEIVPSGPLDYGALSRWYKRHGFLPSHIWQGIYIRRPKENS